MSAKIWLMAGLLAIAMPAAAQQSRNYKPATDNSQASERGRVAVTTDGDAGLWWVPVADTNGKRKHARLCPAQLASTRRRAR